MECSLSENSRLSCAFWLPAAALLLALTSCKEATDQGQSVSGKDLLHAVKYGDHSRISYLLNEGAHLEVRDDKGDTALLHSVRHGNIEMVDTLSKRGADLKAQSGNGKGALELAVESGNHDMVKYLVTNGLDAGQLGRDKNPLLFTAFESRDVQMVSLLLKYGADPDAAGKKGLNALHLAAKLRFAECLKLLIDSGANIEAKDDSGATALWYALSSGARERESSLPCLRLLLDHGANATARGAKKMSLLAESVRRGSYSDVIELLNHAAGSDYGNYEASQLALEIAQSDEAHGLLELLIQGGVDGRELLDRSVAKKDVFLIELLLRAGVPPEHWEGAGKDSLMAFAVRHKSPDMVRSLAHHGLPLDDQGLEGEYPLHMAIGMRDSQLVKALLCVGHDPNKFFKNPASKDFLAIVEKESTRWFLKNDWRLTPLMMAGNNGDTQIIKSLLDHGAKKYVRSGRYKLYPLNFASRRSDVKSMQVMLGQDPEKERFHAIVDLSDQRVKLYDPKGKVIFNSRVSTGKSGHRTPPGNYVITDKHKKHNSSIYGSSMPFFQRFSNSAIGFHSGNVPGYPASHGCIRLPYSAAKKLFGITPVGTRVIIQK